MFCNVLSSMSCTLLCRYAVLSRTREHAQVDHGIPPSAKRHVGDLGNLKPGKEGTASFDFFIDVDTSAILGRGLIVHAKEDDGGQPTGNSGDRLAQCVVGLKGSS